MLWLLLFAFLVWFFYIRDSKAPMHNPLKHVNYKTGYNL